MSPRKTQQSCEPSQNSTTMASDDWIVTHKDLNHKIYRHGTYQLLNIHEKYEEADGVVPASTVFIFRRICKGDMSHDFKFHILDGKRTLEDSFEKLRDDIVKAIRVMEHTTVHHTGLPYITCDICSELMVVCSEIPDHVNSHFVFTKSVNKN